MALRDRQFYTISEAQSATGIWKTINVSDYRNAIIVFGTSGSANMTFKFSGGIGTNDLTYRPDFSVAQWVSNIWDYVEVVDLQDGSGIDGDTGITLSGTDDVRQLEVNVNALDYITIEVTAYTAGELTANIVLFDNQ